jgi:hypothetical protein
MRYILPMFFLISIFSFADSDEEDTRGIKDPGYSIEKIDDKVGQNPKDEITFC